MKSTVSDAQVAASLDSLDAAIGRLSELEVDLSSIREANAYGRELEMAARRVDALKARFVDEVRRSGVHKVDGHASAKVMSRHLGNLSPQEALRRDKAARVLRGMPLVGAGFDGGAIGACQVDRIARTHGNGRVREALEAHDADIAVLAARLPYKEFDDKLSDWERLTDEDGAGDRAERAHRNRDYAIRTNVDGSRRIDGGCGAVQGAEMQAIHQRFTKLLWDADWAEARSRLGDAATVADLHRTDAQRRADAAHMAWKLAAAAQAGESGGSIIVTNIVMDQETFDRELRRMCGEDPGPDDRAGSLLHDAAAPFVDEDEPTPGDEAPQGAAEPDGGRSAFRCSDVDGNPIHPSEAMSAALLGHVRRVVIGADGVVLDAGRLRRLFSGPQRDAVMLSGQRCSWVGCLVPSSQCQADHLEAFNGPNEGRTNPGNGAPLCGRHNRLKERGFALYRDERGRLHVVRPDGTEIL